MFKKITYCKGVSHFDIDVYWGKNRVAQIEFKDGEYIFALTGVKIPDWVFSNVTYWVEKLNRDHK